MSVHYRVLPVVLAAVLLAGCRSATFNGSRTGNDSQLIMEYAVFNTTDSQTLELERGDRLLVEIVQEKGTLSLSIEGEGEESLYADENAQSGSFELEIPEDGSYQVTVSGEKARGRLSVVRLEQDA